MSNNWDVNYMRRIAGLPLVEWDTDTEEHRGEATDSGIEHFIKELNVEFPISSRSADTLATKIERMSNDTGYGSTISSDDVIEYLTSRELIVG
jgi:hypothetical protein